MAKKSMITDEVKELIREVAKETASAVCFENAAGEIDYYKAMEALLSNYTKLAALVENEAAYINVELQGKSKSIVTFSPGSGYAGTKTDEEILDELRRHREIQYHKTKARFDREKYPNALLYYDGTPKPCCSDLGYCKECPEVTTCEECWNMPVEEDE